MADFTAGAVLTAAQLDTAFNTFTINDETGTTYTLAASDAGELVSIANNSGGTVTIPLNATVPFETGTHIHIVNAGTAGTYTIAIAGGGTLNGSGTSLAAGAAASVYKTATNTWRVLPFSTGSAWATVSGTTGSPTVTSITGYTVYDFAASGSFTLPATGWVETLVCGGGGGAATGTGGSGGGGGVRYGSFLLAAGTYTVTVGAGGAGGASGSPGGLSEIVGVVSVGGGEGANSRTTHGWGGGGAGAAAGADLGAGAGTVGRTDPADGVTSSIDGTSRMYGRGGPNTGGIAPVYGSGGRYNTSGEAGATGRVIIRVAV
jgi:hypothetical protein